MHVLYVNPDNNGIAKGSVGRGGKSLHLIYICIANLHGVKRIQTTTVALEITVFKAENVCFSKTSGLKKS